MDGRPILFVGDIQGCSGELALLLEQAGFRPKEHRLIPVGDTINRGPDASGVLDLLERMSAEPILGNHELALLGVWRRRAVPDWAQGPQSAFTQLDAQGCWDRRMVEISTWPEIREGAGWIAVHAGLHPTLSPKATDPWFLTGVRYCDEAGRMCRPTSEAPLQLPPGCRPWFEHYQGDRTVIFGHWAKRGLVREGRVRGLDSGCVYGRQLSGLWWPEDRLVQVQALQEYASPAGPEDPPMAR